MQRPSFFGKSYMAEVRDLKSKKILVVDDEQGILETIKDELEHQGLEVIVTDSPIQAMELLETNQIAVAVVDYKMPRMNGVELLTNYENANPNKKTSYVLLSGHLSKEEMSVLSKDFRNQYTLIEKNSDCYEQLSDFVQKVISIGDEGKE